MRAHLSLDDFEKFSAYLDGQLPPAEKLRLEERIKSDPEWRQAIEELAATRTLLRSAPRYRAPRNFTITPEQARQYARKPLFPVLPAFRFSAALAALSLIAVVMLQFISFGGVQPAQTIALAPAAAPQAENQPAPTQAAAKALSGQPAEPTLSLEWQNSDTNQGEAGNAAANQPGIIAQPSGGIVTYGDQIPNAQKAYGMGGGGGGGGSSPIGPITLPPNAVSGMSESQPTAEAPALAAPAATQNPAATSAPEQQRAAVQPDQSNNPILGLPQPGEGGKIISSSGPATAQTGLNPVSRQANQSSPALPPLRIVQIGLGVLALLAIAAALIFRSRRA
jgi:hypothetical protein